MANGRKTGGRHAGTPNKFNADLRAMILGALSDVGGQRWLARQAEEHPTAFMALLGRVLPLQLAGQNGAPVAIDFRWADANPAEPAESPTPEPEALAAAGAGFVVSFADDAEAEPG